MHNSKFDEDIWGIFSSEIGYSNTYNYEGNIQYFICILHNAAYVCVRSVLSKVTSRNFV